MVIGLKNIFGFCFNAFIKNLIQYKFYYFKVKFFGEYFVNNERTILSKQIEKNKNVIIYGFGPYGEEYFIYSFTRFRIKGLYDKNYKKMDIRIENPDLITNRSFDYIIVTVMEKKARESVVSFLLDKNIQKDKMIFVNYDDRTN